MAKFMLKEPDDAVGSAWPASVIGLFAAFGGVLFEPDTDTISCNLAMLIYNNSALWRGAL
jgi:hypothetical protein